MSAQHPSSPAKPAEAPSAPRRFLTPYEKGVLERDAKGLRKVMEDPESGEEARRNAAVALRRTEENLGQNAAPYLGPQDRDRMKKRVADLEEKLKVGLLSSEEMRRNPHGAVTRNVEWERRNKHLVTRWRNGIRALNPDAPAHVLTDMCSLENLRPRSSSMSMADCQIPQTRSFSFAPGDPQYQANYDAIDWKMGAQTAVPKVDPRAELMSQFDEDEPAEPAREAELGDFAATTTASAAAVPSFTPPAPPAKPGQPVQNQASQSHQKHPNHRR